MRWDHLCWLIVLFRVWLLPSHRNLGVGYYLSFQRDGPRSCEEYPRFVENLHVKMAEKEFIITSFLKYFISKVNAIRQGRSGAYSQEEACKSFVKLRGNVRQPWSLPKSGNFRKLLSIWWSQMSSRAEADNSQGNS